MKIGFLRLDQSQRASRTNERTNQQTNTRDHYISCCVMLHYGAMPTNYPDPDPGNELFYLYLNL